MGPKGLVESERKVKREVFTRNAGAIKGWIERTSENEVIPWLGRKCTSPSLPLLFSHFLPEHLRAPKWTE